MRSEIKLLRLVILTIMFLFSCNFGSKYPDVVLDGVEDRAIRTLRTDQLGRLTTNLTDKQVELKIVEVTLSDRNKERRAFLTFSNNQYEYLGQLHRLIIGEPLEFILFEINDNRFVVIWVDEAAANRPTFVTLARPQQLPSDDSMSVLNTGEVTNRVALIPISKSHAQLWRELTAVRVTGRDVTTGYAWKKTFEPPLWLDSHFVEVNLPW